MSLYDREQTQNVEATLDELSLPFVQEQIQVASASITARTFTGGLAGAGIGILCGVGMASGAIPQLTVLNELGITVPLMLGSCMAGIGTILGTYVDLTSFVNGLRR